MTSNRPTPRNVVTRVALIIGMPVRFAIASDISGMNATYRYITTNSVESRLIIDFASLVSILAIFSPEKNCFTDL